MPVAVDPKPPKPRLDEHRRIVRKKPELAVLDHVEARSVLPEKQYREMLWLDFCRFARSHDGIVISVPWRSPATVLVPLGNGETSRLEIALQQLPKYPVVKLPSTAVRLSHGVFETMRELEVHLWC
jgi:hypothetical protein